MASSLSLEEIRRLEERLKAKQKGRRYPLPPVEPKEKKEKKDKWGEMTSTGEGVSIEEIRALVNRLKQRRTLWGLTQGQLGELVCYKYGVRLTQSVVSRLEMMDCTVSTARRLYRPMKEMLELIDEIYEENGPQLTEALCEAVRRSIGDVAPTVRERKRRVTYTDDQLRALDNFFKKCESPTSSQLNRFAVSLGLDFSEVRVWFCNRRQKRRRMSSNTPKNKDGTTAEILTELERQGEVKVFSKPPTIRAHLQKQGTDLAPLIESLDRMPKEEIVINVSQKT